MPKFKKLSELKTGECGISEKKVLKHVNNNLTRKRLDGRRFKEMLRLSAIKAKAKASGHKMLGRREELSQEGDEANCCKEVDKKVVESPILCSEGQRADCNLTREECNFESENDCSQLSPAGGRKGQAQNSTQIMDEHDHDAEPVKSQSESENESHCAICMLDGKLLCCSGQGCKRSFHLSCVDPPLTFDPPGIWHCSWCTRKKIEFGVYSVSQGIEFILDNRVVCSNDKEMRKQKDYLVKYKSLAHVHNRWIPETQLRLEAPMVFERYKWKKNKWKDQWSEPHRLVKRRLVISPAPCKGYDDENSDCDFEWLVKWKGLNYDHCTWELANASFLKTPQAMMLIKKFESRKQNSNTISDPSMKDEERKTTPVQLSEFPFEVSPGLHGYQFTYVNKLRGYWSRGHNAVVFDEDRIEKVVLFILSLQCDACQPVLVITSSNTISLWEAQFSCCSSSTNVVVYNGNRDVRAIIRNLEFYDESGRVSFQVLLATPDAVVEDLEMLDHIKWETMVIDECQRPVISMHLVQLKILAADMKLLLFSGEVLDRKINYHNVISLIDTEFEEINEDMALDSNTGTLKLKELLAEFIAYECKFDTRIFSEYWVPVRLTSMQIEQYRDLLQSNSRLLCSSLKNDASDPLREVLSSAQKCCDHPYLVDHSLRSSVTRDLPTDDHLSAEINVSGKLQLLDMILSEVKKHGLKVLVLFQSVAASGKISIGDILDDLVHRRFGEDNYARIEGGMARSKRQAALDMFNNKESTSIICLMDYRACASSIKLSSLNIVVMFNSDLNPLNDLRSLQKITIDPQLEQIKVFRLFSCFTIEEKSLILAKQGVSFDSKPQRIIRSICHILLSWGASYLCQKSNDFNTYISSEKSFLDNVLSELLAKISNTDEDDVASNGSIILKLKPTEGSYPSNIKVFGEVENPSTDILDSEAPYLFWRNVLKERHNPKLKHLYTPSRSVPKKAQMHGASFEGFESENATNKHQKGVNSTISKMRSRNKRKLIADVDGSKLMEASGLSTGKRSKRLRKTKTARDESRTVSMDYVGRDNVTSSGHVTGIEQHGAIQMDVKKPKNDCSNKNMMKQETVARQESLSPSHQNLSNHEIPSCWSQVKEQPPLDDSSKLATISPPSLPSTYAYVVTSESDTSHLRNTNAGSESQNSHPLLSVTHEVAHSAETDPLQMVTSESDTSHLRNTNAGSESLNSHPLLSVTHEVAHSAETDPLQMEIERIQNDKDKATKTHQEMQWRINLECEEEIAAIRKKYMTIYDALIEESKMELMKQMEILERKYKIVYDNKLLAEALVKKCDTAEVAFSDVTQEETISLFEDDISQHYDHSTLRSSPMADLLVAPTIAETQRATPPSQDMNLPSCPAPIISPVEARYLSIPTTNSFGNSLPESGFGAPSPHLKNTKTLPYASPPNLTTCHPLPRILQPPSTPFTLTQATPSPRPPIPIEMQSGNLGTSSVISFPPPDLSDCIYSFPPLDFDLSILFSQ